MNKEKHCSVIDAEGKHVTYVLVKIRDKPLEDGGTEQVEEVQNYTLKDGEQLVDASPPSMRQHAGNAATERSDFIEDCIAEMAMQVYAE